MSKSPGPNQHVFHAAYFTGVNGYERWSDGMSDESVGVHQLMVISEGADPNKVFSGGEYHVHHMNNIPWDNRVDNIELITNQKHGFITRGNNDSKPTKELLKKLYWHKNWSEKEIADHLDINKRTVRRYIKDYELRWDQKGPNA